MLRQSKAYEITINPAHNVIILVTNTRDNIMCLKSVSQCQRWENRSAHGAYHNWPPWTEHPAVISFHTLLQSLPITQFEWVEKIKTLYWWFNFFSTLEKFPLSEMHLNISIKFCHNTGYLFLTWLLWHLKKFH